MYIVFHQMRFENFIFSLQTTSAWSLLLYLFYRYRLFGYLSFSITLQFRDLLLDPQVEKVVLTLFVVFFPFFITNWILMFCLLSYVIYFSKSSLFRTWLFVSILKNHRVQILNHYLLLIIVTLPSASGYPFKGEALVLIIPPKSSSDYFFLATGSLPQT